eukprot:3377107-Rhodomonas_salina.4
MPGVTSIRARWFQHREGTSVRDLTENVASRRIWTPPNVMLASPRCISSGLGHEKHGPHFVRVAELVHVPVPLFLNVSNPGRPRIPCGPIQAVSEL